MNLDCVNCLILTIISIFLKSIYAMQIAIDYFNLKLVVLEFECMMYKLNSNLK